jgi:NodT family efflux transporter outer membrane factor (OMF) lipoprotein
MTLQPLHIARRTFIALAVAGLASGCAVGPDYVRPSTPEPAAYKELQGWVQATPSDALERGEWWTVFNDPVLNELASAVEVSNQNVAAAAAAYAQARALVSQQRAALFPVVTLDGGATRSGSDSRSTVAGTSGTTSTSRSGSNVQLGIGGSWEPDVWGRLGRAVSGATASAQASAADLASARLSAQGELVINYLSVRQIDAQRRLLADTIEGYKRVMQITQNRYAAGVAAKTDVLQAETQLANAQADDMTLESQRAQLEHAIAVLIGKAPSEFALAPADWRNNVPEVPVGVPSTLLQRRPDIAAAERRVATANEQIGIAKSAYFPSIGLNASYGGTASNVADLISVPNTVWSLGLSVAQTIFNAGETRARVSAAEAAQQEAAARYRQTVLSAFASVEDQLTASRILAQQETLRRRASAAADQAEQQMINRYRAGQVGYTEVVTAQASALNARRALVQVQADRQIAAVSLMQAIGGGWKGVQD